MALVTVPFTSLYLVPHVSGGAIAHMAGGYIAHTFVPAAIVEAFGVAASVLAQLSSSAGAVATATTSVATNPLVLGGVALAAVAMGTYCYFQGIPAPIEAALSKAGLGTATKHGLMVSVPKLAVTLILLGGAGYVTYRFYKSRKAERLARLIEGSSNQQTRDQAKWLVYSAFGDRAWSEFGSTIWSSASELGRKSKQLTWRALLGAGRPGWVANLAKELSSQATLGLRDAVAAASSLASSAAGLGFSGTNTSSKALLDEDWRIERWFRRLGLKFGRRRKPV
jgi:hypothetical protein